VVDVGPVDITTATPQGSHGRTSVRRRVNNRESKRVNLELANHVDSACQRNKLVLL